MATTTYTIALDYPAITKAVAAATPAQSYNSVKFLFGVAAFFLLLAYVIKPASVAAPVVSPATLDYSAITSAVKAGFPVKSDTVKSEPVKSTAVVKHKPRKAKAKVKAATTSGVVYVVPTYSGCTCML